jgi:hypothetical protein
MKHKLTLTFKEGTSEHTIRNYVSAFRLNWSEVEDFEVDTEYTAAEKRKMAKEWKGELKNFKL